MFSKMRIFMFSLFALVLAAGGMSLASVQAAEAEQDYQLAFEVASSPGDEDIREQFSALMEEGAYEEAAALADELFPQEGYGKPDEMSQKANGLAAPSLQWDSSRHWEEFTSCGFYPQESRLACGLDIKQQGGYGGPVGAFGSFEYVQFCVDWNNNGVFDTSGTWGSIESVGAATLHMHDDYSGSPPWQYAVYRDITPPGGPRTDMGGATSTTTTNAPSFRARAILSWAFAPKDCNYVPIWGDVVDFQIRLDPVR